MSKYSCVDRIIAKELKDLGFPQNTYYSIEAENDIVSQPSVNELLDILPKNINNIFDLAIIWNNFLTEFEISYINTENSHLLCFEDCDLIGASALADGLAKMWIYLKKKGIIK